MVWTGFLFWLICLSKCYTGPHFLNTLNVLISQVKSHHVKADEILLSYEATSPMEGFILSGTFGHFEKCMLIRLLSNS